MQTFTFSAEKHTVAGFVETTVGEIVAHVKQFRGEKEVFVVEVSSDAEATELAAALRRGFSEAPLKDCVAEANRNEGKPVVFCLAAHKK